MPVSELLPIFLRIPKDNIALLIFLLESYDGLGVLRTINAAKGEVVILALSDTADIVNEFLLSVQKDLDCQLITPPESIKDDWLLAEFFSESLTSPPRSH